LIMGWIKCQ